MVELWKSVGGNLVFVDYGIKTKVDEYCRGGFIVIYK